jgi:putative transposase
MFFLEFKAKGLANEYNAVDEAIRTAQFVRNKSIFFWMDNRGVGQKEYSYTALVKYSEKSSPLLKL